MSYASIAIQVYRVLDSYYSNYRKDEMDSIKESEIKAKELVQEINDGVRSLREEYRRKIMDFVDNSRKQADEEIRSQVCVDYHHYGVFYRRPERVTAIINEINDEREQFIDEDASKILSEIERNPSVLDKYK